MKDTHVYTYLTHLTGSPNQEAGFLHCSDWYRNDVKQW